MTTQRDHRITYIQNFYCTFLAGITSRTLISPLVVVKNLTQIGSPETQNGYLHAIKKLFENEGPRAFFKGNWIGCIHMFLYSAINFSGFSYLKLKLANDQGRLTPFCAMVTGAGAATIGTICVYPLATVKTRLIAQRKKAFYTGIFSAFNQIVRNEGPRKLYSGIGVTLLGIVPFTASAFMAYEILDILHGQPRWQLKPFEALINGCIATTFAHTIIFPIETVSKKMQAQSAVLPNGGGVDIQFKGAVNCLKETMSKHGNTGPWRGLLASVLRFGTQSMLMFMVYDSLKKVFLFANGFTMAPMDDTPRPGVDQSLTCEELEDLNRQFDIKVV